MLGACLCQGVSLFPGKGVSFVGQGGFDGCLRPARKMVGSVGGFLPMQFPDICSWFELPSPQSRVDGVAHACQCRKAPARECGQGLHCSFFYQGQSFDFGCAMGLAVKGVCSGVGPGS